MEICAQVFHTDILVYYAEQKASGREFPKSFVGDDIHQVCGAFVTSGAILLTRHAAPEALYITVFFSLVIIIISVIIII